jgi:hypothetical protein
MEKIKHKSCSIGIKTSIFRPGLLGLGMTVDKNMNSGLIHIPGGKL